MFAGNFILEFYLNVVKKNREEVRMYQRVKALAEEKGYSIAALEKAAGIANGTIGKWKDSDDGIRLKTLKALVKVLDVSIEELIKE